MRQSNAINKSLVNLELDFYLVIIFWMDYAVKIDRLLMQFNNVINTSN